MSQRSNLIKFRSDPWQEYTCVLLMWWSAGWLQKTPPMKALEKSPCELTSCFYVTGSWGVYKQGLLHCCHGPVLFSRVPAVSIYKCSVFVVRLMRIRLVACEQSSVLSLLSAGSRFRTHSIPCEVCGGKWHCIRYPPPQSNSVFPCQYHSISAPFPYSIHLPYALYNINTWQGH
jgi:hypothetical protein